LLELFFISDVSPDLSLPKDYGKDLISGPKNKKKRPRNTRRKTILGISNRLL
jgi:hypothetical protein